MKKSLLALTALSLSASVSACSMHHDDKQGYWSHKDHSQMMAKDMFNDMDKNGDGVITKREYADYTKAWFKAADTNNDGKLTYEELKAKLKSDKERLKADHHAHHQQMQDDGTVNNDSSTYDNQPSHY